MKCCNYLTITLLVKYISFSFINCELYSNHSLIFISGWPQSGTSLVNQLLSLSPHISTMIDKCNQIHGKKCYNWNHEGQWLISDDKLINIFNPGSMCPINKSVYIDNHDFNKTIISDMLFNDWSSYWNNNIYTLAEKSPHFLLKIPFIHYLLQDRATNIKFIIVLKHPATLNIATSRGYEWLTNRNNSDRAIVSNTDKEVINNLDTFINFMTLDRLDFSTNKCEISWLTSIEILHDQLKSIHSNAQIKIVRYEQFLQPFILCKNLFEYIFTPLSLEYKYAMTNICAKYFSNFELLSHSSTSSKVYQRHKHNKKISSKYHRNLRMKEIQGLGSFQFNIDVVKSSVSKRLSDFKIALSRATNKQKEILNKINKRLEKYGYSFNFNTLYLLKYKLNQNQLNKWELLNDKML